MMTLFRNATVYENGTFKKTDMCYNGVTLVEAKGDLSSLDFSSIFDNVFIFPGFCDVHVHLREPGFSYKETIKTGTSAEDIPRCSRCLTSHPYPTLSKILKRSFR